MRQWISNISQILKVTWVEYDDKKKTRKAETMADRYKNDNDVTMRLHETALKYKGKVYYAKSVGQGLLLDLYDASNAFKTKHHRVDANDDDLDIQSLEVGLVNWEDCSVFITARSPVRKQKQGIGSENLMYRNLIDDKKTGSGYFSNIHHSVLYSKNFFSMLNNEYPSYKEAHDAALNPGPLNSNGWNWWARAFSRKLALALDKKEPERLYLYLDGVVIAEKQRSDSHWYLHAHYNDTTTAMFLQEHGVPLY